MDLLYQRVKMGVESISAVWLHAEMLYFTQLAPVGLQYNSVDTESSLPQITTRKTRKCHCSRQIKTSQGVTKLASAQLSFYFCNCIWANFTGS